MQRKQNETNFANELAIALSRSLRVSVTGPVDQPKSNWNVDMLKGKIIRS